MSDAADSIGSMATAGLIAREIDRAHRGAPAIGHAENEPCANCGAERNGPYCHQCGQAGHVHKNLMALVHDLAHGVFHFEGKIWKTLPMLAWRPGQLTRRYIDGERAKFVSPMALFLFSVFLMFAVVSNFAHSGQLVSVNAPNMGKVAKAQAELKALPGSNVSFQRGLPATQSAVAIDVDKKLDLEKNGFDTGVRWFDASVAHITRNPELAAYKMKSYAYKYSWALIPISLPFIWLLFFWRRDVGLYDHAIFSIYSLSFMSLAVVVLSLLDKAGLPWSLIALTASIVPPVHMYRQLKGAYRLGWWGAWWRMWALLLITIITLSLFVSFLFWMGTN